MISHNSVELIEEIILNLLLLARELKGQNWVQDANLLKIFNADSTAEPRT